MLKYFKYLIAFLFLILLLFLFQTDSFGFSFIGSDKKQYNVPDLPFNTNDYYFFMVPSYNLDGFWNIFTIKKTGNPTIFFKDSSNEMVFYSDTEPLISYFCLPENSSWSKRKDVLPGYFAINNIVHDFDSSGNNRIVLLTNFDIYYEDGLRIFLYNNFLGDSFVFEYNDMLWDVPALPKEYNDGRPFFISGSAEGGSSESFNGYIVSFPLDFINHNDISFYNNRPDIPEGIFYNSDGRENSSGEWIYFTCSISEYFWEGPFLSTDGFMWLKNSEFDTFQDVMYSSIPIYDSSGNLYFEDGKLIKYDFSITLSTYDKTIEPIIAYSNWFNYDKTYIVEISRDGGNTYESMQTEIDTKNNNNYRKYAMIYSNGDYLFKFTYFISDSIAQEYYLRVSVTNFNLPGDGNYDDENYIPSPHMSLDYNEEKECFILKTQKIYLNKSLFYKCLYSDIGTTDYSVYSEMQIEIVDNEDFGYAECYFYFEIPVLSAKNCDYTILFYHYLNNKYGDPIVYHFDLDKSLDYIENILDKELGFSVRFKFLIDYFGDRFGFLTYPFEFISDICNRIFKISYTEPVLNIPDISEPFTGQVIVQHASFNFNDFVNSNATFKNIYNIYLVAVDFIIIVGFIFLSKKVIEEVFRNG